MKTSAITILSLVAPSCTMADRRPNGFDTAAATDAPTTTSEDSTSATTTETSGDASDGGDGAKFDVGDSATGGGPESDHCMVVDDMNAVGDCRQSAPPDSFEPEVQWQWQDPTYGQSIVIALVANLTEDNGDGRIDLCDVPDVLVTMFATYGVWDGYLYLLDGETGSVHWRSAARVQGDVTPAIGDIDADGEAEIVTVAHPAGHLIAFETDGSIAWNGASWSGHQFGAIALADLDNDGDVEIIAGNLVVDHTGVLRTTLPDKAGEPGFGNATAVADLDGDGDQEIVIGRSAYHHDGGQLYFQSGVQPGYPQVANLDADAEPEVILHNQNGIAVLNHDGSINFKDLRPTGTPAGPNAWMRPSTVHDFDGDGVSEFALSSGDKYTVYEANATIVWSATVTDTTGVSAGTAFDFLGDGVADAMYGDEYNLFVYDGAGVPLLTVPRSSGTLIEYPVVADVDDDGSAEIVVTSNQGWMGSQSAPGVQVIRDMRDRWIQARRIWNQHTYHVTNVREDGTIPQFEPPSWKLLNTYRTNAQIEGGEVCKPKPEG